MSKSTNIVNTTTPMNRISRTSFSGELPGVENLNNLITYKYKNPSIHVNLITAFLNIDPSRLEDQEYKTQMDNNISLNLKNQIEEASTEDSKPYVNASIINVEGLNKAFLDKSKEMKQNYKDEVAEALRIKDELEKCLNEVAKRGEFLLNLPRKEMQGPDFENKMKELQTMKDLSDLAVADYKQKIYHAAQLEIILKQFPILNEYVHMAYAPIHFACHFNLEKTLKVLIEDLGADPNLPASAIPPNDRRCAEFVTCLQFAQNPSYRDSLIKYIQDYPNYLLTPMTILANNCATESMKTLLDNVANIRYGDAYLYYTKIYETIHDIDQKNSNQELLSKVHTHLFLHCYNRFIYNKDFIVPEIEKLIDDPSRPKENIEELKEGINTANRLVSNFCDALKNLLKADSKVHDDKYHDTKTILDEQEVINLLNNDDKAFGYILYIMEQIAEEKQQARAQLMSSTSSANTEIGLDTVNQVLEVLGDDVLSPDSQP